MVDERSRRQLVRLRKVLGESKAGVRGGWTHFRHPKGYIISRPARPVKER